MAKLQRKSAKLFAENATASAGGLAQFGSLAAGTPNYSTDPDVIQALPAYGNGWSDAVLGTKSPALEDRNALDYLLSYQQAYIMQHGVPEWLDTETYYKNSYVVDSNGQLRYSLIDNNTGNDPTDDDLGQVSWGFGGARGTGKSVGEVYFSQSNLATDNPGALPLWTGELISNANNIYPQFYAWVEDHSSLCVTQAEYDTAISTYGECPFYVITSTSIRLPKLANYLKMASGNALSQSGAGLPNITGYTTGGNVGNTGSLSGGGALFQTPVGGSNNGVSSGSGRQGTSIRIDASRSSSVYGNSNTVTPAHTTLYPWVYVYNQAIAASTAQAAQFQAALSSKADIDLANCTKPYVTETYVNGTSWYRVWSDGWCEQGGRTSASSGYGFETITLLKTMADTNYTLLNCNNRNGQSSDQRDAYIISNTQIGVGYDNSQSDGAIWKVEGYLPSES